MVRRLGYEVKLFNIVFLVVSLLSTSVAIAEKSEEEKLLEVQKSQILDRPVLMVGMGLTQLMSDDYYIGAFYIDQAAQYSGGEDLVYIEAPRRMEFRFASNRKISGRGFGRKIAEGIRINNAKTNVDDENRNLQRFIKFFKGNYKKGDVIQFDYHDSFGTRVNLNGRRLGEINNSADLYRLLVRIWVGDRPPSSQFKKGITGNNEAEYAIELLRKFVSLK